MQRFKADCICLLCHLKVSTSSVAVVPIILQMVDQDALTWLYMKTQILKSSVRCI